MDLPQYIDKLNFVQKIRLVSLTAQNLTHFLTTQT